jgi:hypothetical protein
MIGGLLKSSSRLALVAAAGLFVGGVAMPSAKAADLGGDCCADLEERVAELEATTARKGNRKMSLTITGQVNKGILFTDNKHSSFFAPGVDNTAGSSRFSLEGAAKFSSKWTTGYRIMIEYDFGNTSLRANINGRQDCSSSGTSATAFGTGNTQICSGASISIPTAGAAQAPGFPAGTGILNTLAATYTLPTRASDALMDMREVNWYLEHADLGRVTVGRTNVFGVTGAIDIGGIAVIAPAVAALIGGNTPLFGKVFVAAGAINPTSTLLALDTAGQQLGNRTNGMRYDSPVWHGFTFGATYGDGIYWSMGARYANEFNGVRVALSAGYEKDMDWSPYAQNGFASSAAPGTKTHLWGFGGAIMEVHTGLFFQAGWWQRVIDTGTTDGAPTTAVTVGTAFEIQAQGTAASAKMKVGDSWLLQAGISQNWFGIGRTIPYVEWGKYDNMAVMTGTFTFGTPLAGNSGTLGGNPISMLETYTGIGLVQNVDAAATEFYLGWRRYDNSWFADGINPATGAAIAAAAGSASCTPAAGGCKALPVDVVMGGARVKF